MLSETYSVEKLQEKAEQLKKRGFTPGYDKMTSDAIVIWMGIHGSQLCHDLLHDRYNPMPALGFISAKKDGGFRQLSGQTAIDTVVQLCLLDTLTPICEERFSGESFAYRPGRGVGAALAEYCRLGLEYPFAARIDIKACFDSIDHTVLRNIICTFTDEDAANLIMKFARQPLLSEGIIEKRTKGILQGSPLSPLLCNMYMDSCDKFLEENGVNFIRYADDIILFDQKLDRLKSTLETAENYLAEKLYLQINKSKCVIDSPVAFRFLGHCFDRDRAGRIEPTPDGFTDEVYYGWYDSKPRNTKKTWNILSDGILRQKDFTLYFETETEKNSIPICSVERINIYADVILDSRSLQKALDAGIYINIFDKYGKLLGRFVPNAPLKGPQVVYEQLRTYYTEKERIDIAKEFVLSALHNARLNIRYYAKHDENDIYFLTTEELKDFERKIKKCSEYSHLLILEAQMHKSYYSCFDFMIKAEQFMFEKRTRQPPDNEVNSMISFGNTVLYNIIATRIYTSALDIRVGYLHATNNREESLNLDVAEIFKPLVVDRVIFTLINMRQIRSEHFVRINSGVYLTAEGKRIFLKAFHTKLDEGITIDGKFWTYDMLIDEEIRKLVRRFRHAEKYKAFRQVR